MTADEPKVQWWLCCWGHVFPHPLVGEAEEISCPSPDGESGVCGTFFIYAPFDTEEAARAALTNGIPRSAGKRWAPWAR